MEIILTRELIRSILWICISVNSEEPFPLPEEITQEYLRWLSSYSEETGIRIKKCHRCRHLYLPDFRNIRHQKYCYFGCRKWMERMKKRERNKNYRRTRRYRFTKSQQNHRYRVRWREKEGIPPSPSTPQEMLSIQWIMQRVLDVISRYFSPLSQATMDWIYKVIREEIEDFYKKEEDGGLKIMKIGHT